MSTRIMAYEANKTIVPPDTIADKMLPLHEDPDARRWAQEFMHTFRNDDVPVDEGTMILWFANAMCAQMDFDHRRQAKADSEREVYVLINANTSELIAVYSKLPCKSICDRDYSLFLGKDLETIGGSDIPTAGQGSNWNCILYKAKVDSLNRIKEHCAIEYQTDK